jgi:hypothetical protein
MIENPQPAWLPLLLLLMPGIGFAAYALNKALFPEDNRPLCTIPAIGIVLALLPTHALALMFASLSTGLTLAWGLVGVAGYAWIARHWGEFRSALSDEHAGRARKLGIAALTTLPIVLPTILLNFHDEAYFNGHFAIIAHLQNGAYPPRYLYEPSLPLRYHYGFDLACAIITGVLRVRVDHAVDLLTLTLWPCMFLLLWRVGDLAGGKTAGLLVAATVCFSTGWCILCSVDGQRSNPPFTSYYFQHPWSLGVPIFCLALLQHAALPRLANRTLGWTALACSLSLLSLCQAVLFVTTVAALGLTAVWRLARFRDHVSWRVLSALAASLASSRLLGGFFVAGQFPPAGGLFGTGIYLRVFSSGDALLSQALWNLETFGLLLFAGVVGLFYAARDRMLWFILATLPIVVVNSLHYRYSWDIVKFAMISSIALGVGTGIALSELRRWADTLRRKMIWGVLVVALLWQGVLFPFISLSTYDPIGRAAFSRQMIRPYFSRAYPVDDDDAQAVSFLRTHMGRSEIVYRAVDKSEPYANWGGLPTQASVYAADSMYNDMYGLGEAAFSARRNLSDVSDTWFDRLSTEHVVWIVTDPDDTAIEAALASPEGRRRTLLAAQYGKVRVYHLH